MNRYYFHIKDKEHLVRDEEGQDCSDLEAVRSEAKQSALELISDRMKRGVELDGDIIEVHDENGAVVHRVKLSDLVN